MLNRKDKAIIVLIVLLVVSYPFIVKSQTPPGPNTLEHGQGLNFPTITAINGFYLGATNLTDRLQGTWDVALTAPTLDTGQGANELYDMDQNVLTTSTPEFAGLQASWFELNGDNRTSWPIGGVGGVEELSFNHLVLKNASGTYWISGSNGTIIGSAVDDDDLFNWIDGNSSGGIIHVKTGTYSFDAWQPTNTWKIVGDGWDFTIFNLTNSDWSIQLDGDIHLVDLQIYSNVDGPKLIYQDASATYERVYFNLPMMCEDSIGVIYYRGGSDDSAEFIDCKINGGDGDGTKFFFFYWGTDINRLYIDNLYVPLVNASSTSYARLFVPATGTWCNEADINDVYIENWIAGGSTDSGFIYSVLRTIDTLSIDGFTFLTGDFTGTAHQLMMDGPMAENTFLNDIHCYYRTHGYAGHNYTSLTKFYLEGDETVRSAFDFGVHGDYPRFGVVSNGILKNASLTVNSGYQQFDIENVMFFGSRFFLCDEQPADDGDKYVTGSGLQWFYNETFQGPDYSNRAIEISHTETQDLRQLRLTNCLAYGVEKFIQVNDSPATKTMNITIDGLWLGPDLGTDYPELIDGSARDGNTTIHLFNAEIFSNTPPLDDWNPIQKNDKFHNVKWTDIDTDAITFSENVFNVTISSGSSSATVSHGMPTRTIWSNFQITPTSDLANCTYYWVPWGNFSSSQIVVYVGASGSPKNCDDDITFIAKTELNP